MVLPSLAQCGKRLPIGIPNFEAGTLEKRFDVIPLTWPIERAIGRSWSKKRSGMSMGDYIGTILAYTVTQLGDLDMSKLKFNDRLAKLESMYSADVFYMYAYLRVVSMGNELRLNALNCVSSSCGHKFNYVADVSTLSVLEINNVKDLEKQIVLKDGMTIAGSVRNKFVIQPQKWESLGFSGTDVTEQEIFERIAISSIVEVIGMPRGVVLCDVDFAKLSKPDIETLREELDKFVAGPRWVIEGKCPKCNETFFFEVDWMYQNFFSNSYTSRRRKKQRTK
jgi:hypothetical protein